MAHLIVTMIRTVAPGGSRAVIGESLLLKHQLLILNRSRKKAPKLRDLDRILLGLRDARVSSAHAESRGRRQALNAATVSPSTGPA